MKTKGFSSLTFTLLLSLGALTATTVPFRANAADANASPDEKVKVPFESAAGLSLASTNDHFLVDIRQRRSASLDFDPDDSSIAPLVVEMLRQGHYLKLPLNDGLSSKFLDRYIEALDYLHLHFLQIDLESFEKYRTELDDLTKQEKADLTPARVIFERFLQRIEQRVAYVQELLNTETFTFTGDDRYNLNRKEAPRPKTMAEARQLWRQHLRYEILQEKLAKEKPADIANKITRRYARLLRTFKDLDGQDVFEIYLSALTHVFDPHSDYMGKSSYTSFNISMALSLSGIGAVLEAPDGYCTIRSLMPNAPAERSKMVKAGDRIIAVAQSTNAPVDVIEEPLRKVVEMIRGPKGTEVRLTIIPEDSSSTRKVVSLIRDDVKLEDQEAKAKIIDMPADNGKTLRVGVIDLPTFYSDFKSQEHPDKEKTSTTTDVRKLLRKLMAEKVEGVILDLRRNGGGSLEEAINLTGLFIKEGPVVQVRDSRKKIGIDEDPDPSMFYDGPLVVLTSRFSASASEILAGALQDYGRALIVGDSSTHGKGTVQTLQELDRYIAPVSSSTNNPGALKYTIRKFYRASGSSTQLEGVTPDIVLPSVNNFAEVGEKSLDNPLAWDTIQSAKFVKFDWIQPLLPDLKKQSEKRVAGNKDYDYVREDIEQYQKMLKDRTVSLNETERLKERDELETRKKAREAEMKARKEPEEKAYEITVKLTAQPGLPDPIGKTNSVAAAKASAEPHVDAEKPVAAAKPKSTDDDEDDDMKPLPVDHTLKESKRILADLIALWPKRASVAKN